MHAFLTSMVNMQPRATARGFTLIELMIVVLIAAILLAIGLPNMTDFIAEQRVRSTASDITSEIMFARAKAVEMSRRVIMEKLGAGWDQGWRIYVDVNNSGAYEAGTDIELKQFNGFGTGAASSSGRGDASANG
jgi:type IV fimbrial biogenesis protein FimT